MLRTLKHATLRLANRLGGYEIVANSGWRRKRLLILCYHGVSQCDEHEWSDLYVSAEHLRKRFDLLRSNGYSVLPLAEGVRRLYDHTLPPRAVAITFDDGAVDFYRQAYPILQDFGFHATLYLTTYYCRFQRPVFDTVVSFLLWKGRGQRLALSDLIRDGGIIVVPEDDAQRAAVHRQILSAAAVRSRSAQEKDALASELAARLSVDYDAILAQRLLHLMTPKEVSSLESKFVSVELHTHRHRTPRCASLFDKELRDNKEALASMRPPKWEPRHFCYPSGDYAPEFLPVLRQHGIVSATSCDPQIASTRSDPLLLPRFVDTMSAPSCVFEGWISGVCAFLPQQGMYRRQRWLGRAVSKSQGSKTTADNIAGTD